jgi:hypothetical protein
MLDSCTPAKGAAHHIVVFWQQDVPSLLGGAFSPQVTPKQAFAGKPTNACLYSYVFAELLPKKREYRLWQLCLGALARVG